MALRETSSFGDLLRGYRRAAELTQEELAERAELSRRTVSDLERGLYQRPHRDTVRLLAKALELDDEQRDAFLTAARRGDTSAPTAAEQVSGDVSLRTVLITDVRGYTEFTAKWGNDAAARLTAHVARLAKEVVESHGGRVVELRGDEVLAVFGSARQGLRAALALQERCALDATPDLPLHLGVGLDAGEVISVGEGYRGAALNLAARLCSRAGPGEVLASETVTNLARTLENVTYEERGRVALKGFPNPVQVMEIHPAWNAASARSMDTDFRREQASPLAVGSYLGALPASPLVAREEIFDRLLAVLEQARAGSGRAALLAGEPGVGKTRLAQEVMLQGRNRQFLVATGRCYEPEKGTPYYPFLDALAAAYTQAPATVSREAAGRWPHLRVLLPEQLGEGGISRGQDDEQRVLRAVTGFLEALAVTRPVALLLDDLQWADGASIKLLSHLARHMTNVPLLLLGTYRDLEVRDDHPLAGMLHDLGREGLVEQIAVGRLPEAGTGALVGAALGAEGPISKEFRELVYRLTEGNPYFIHHLLRVMIQQGDVYRRDGQWSRNEIEQIRVPPSIKSVIGRQLSRLAEETQAILQEASILGQTFRFEDLLAMTGEQEAKLEQALEEGQKAGLLQTSDGEQYAFDHALTQQALYRDLSPRRRRRLHRAAGSAIESLPEQGRRRRVAELAWHFQKADERERALPYALMAGDQAAAVYAGGEAERQYRVALDLARATGDGRREIEAAEKLADVLEREARHEEARALYEAALALVHDDRFTCSRFHWKIGDTWSPFGAGLDSARAFHAYDIAESMLGEEPDEKDAEWRRAWLDIQMRRLNLTYILGQADESVDLVERTRRAVEEVGTPEQRAELFAQLAVHAQQRSRYTGPEEAVRYQQEVVAAREEVGDVGLAADARFSLGFHYVWYGDLDKAEAHLSAALSKAEHVDDLALQAKCLAYLVTSYRRRGQVDAVREHVARGRPLALAAGTPQYVAMADAHTAWVAWRDRNLGELEARAAAALALWREGQIAYGPFEWMAVWPLLGAALLRDDTNGAVERARELLGPSMQPMPEVLAAQLTEAITAWDDGAREDASRLLWATARAAEELGYL